MEEKTNEEKPKAEKPKIDKSKIEILKTIKEVQVKTNQIIRK